MPVKKPPRVPEFRLHKATGQGYVVLNGQAVYLGRWDRPETEQRYHLLIATWLAAGGKRPPEPFLTGRLSCVRACEGRAAHEQEAADAPVDGFPEAGVVAQAAGAVRARPDVGRGVLCPPARVGGRVLLLATEDQQARQPRLRPQAPEKRAFRRGSTPARAEVRIERPAGDTDDHALRPDTRRQAHPEAVREYRITERRDSTERRQFRRAERRRLCASSRR